MAIGHSIGLNNLNKIIITTNNTKYFKILK